MKQFHLLSFIILSFLLLVNQNSAAQEIQDSEGLLQQVNKECLQLKQTLEAKEYLSDSDKQRSIGFQCDTFKIERLLALKIENDYSTNGMVQAIYEAEQAYDKLLNKYYQVLLKKLNDADKEILKRSQRNWIQFRDSERILNATILNDEYSGGGTLQQLIISSGYLEITKKRVVEIYQYASRIAE